MKVKDNNLLFKSQASKTKSTDLTGPKLRIGQQGGLNFRKSNVGNTSSTLLNPLNMIKTNVISRNENKLDNESSKIQIHYATEEPEEQTQQKRKISVLPSSVSAMISNDCGKTHQITVVARFRPLNEVERKMDEKGECTISVEFLTEDSVNVKNSCGVGTSITLDRIFNFNTPQNQIYEQMAIATINDVLNGYNGTIFAYGQSGSGKTYTMYGNDLFDEAQRGIIPRAISHIFDHIESPQNKDIKFELKFSMLEIYKESLYDLLNTETKSSDLKIKEHPKKGIYVTGLAEEYISSEEEFLLMVDSADGNRVTASTGLNASSSRSHLLFQLEIIQTLPDDTQKRGTLNLVDLAGSEKVSKSQAMGQTLEEAKKINLSLSTLGTVIHALTASNPNEFVPYRDSKLTRILQDSLGGNYKTTLIATCSPHLFNSEETITTLKFAQRAKKIKNKVKVNIKRSVEQLEAVIEELTRQLRDANSVISMLKGQPNGSRIKTEPIETTGEKMKGLIHIQGQGLQQNLSVNFDYTSELKKKDEEISQLNEKIEMLTNENKRLTDMIVKSKNFDTVLFELERMTKTNISELNSCAEKYHKMVNEFSKQESEILRESYRNLDEKYFRLAKDLEMKIKDEDIDQTVYEFSVTIQEQKINIESLFSDKWLGPESYRNIFLHSKMYLSYVLDNFIKKKDVFSDGNNLTHKLLSTVNYNKKLATDYSNLKNSFLKLSALMVYYETFLFSFMNRTAIDIQKYEQETKISNEIEKKCNNWAKVFSSYLDVLEEIQLENALKKKEKNITEASDQMTREKIQLISSFISQESDYDSKADEKDEAKQKVEKHISSKNPEVDSEGDIGGKKEDEQSNHHRLKFSSEAGSEKENISNGAQNKVSEEIEANPDQMLTPYQKMSQRKVIRKITNNNIIRGVVKHPTIIKNLGIVITHLLRENEANDQCGKENDNIKKPMKAITQHHFIRKEKKAMTGIFKVKSDNAKLGAFHQNIDQCRQLKKDIEMYRNSVEVLAMELNAFHSKSSMNEAILTDFQEKQREIAVKEFDNFERILKMYKSFYEDELFNKRHKIEELTKLVDERYINTKNTDLSSSNPLQMYLTASNKKTSKEYFEDCYEYKKEKVLTEKSNYNYDDPKSKLAEAMGQDTGTATKKLDYILFKTNRNCQEMKVRFSSGLQGNLKSKSPLNRNLVISLLGDTCSEPPSCKSDD